MSLLAALTRVLDTDDRDTSAHGERVATLAEVVARRLRWPETSLAALRLGARLHDVGKLTLPGSLLRKPAPLTAAELALVRQHPRTGAALVAPIAAARTALPYVLLHHEHWDGGGYPTGRSGTDVSVGPRLLAVVDAFDAMTSDRPYRRALSTDAAVAELERCAGTQFDPVVTRVFLRAWSEGEIAAARPAVAVG